MTKGYGLTIDDIDWSCPADLEPYSNAYKMKMQQQDYMAWIHNQYTLSAISVAIEHCFSGKKAKSQYVKQPFLLEIKTEEKKEISEEKKKEMENYKLAMTLQIMQANFELNKNLKE